VKKQRASQLAGFAAVVIAATALGGWWTGMPLLASWGVGITVRPPVAVGLIALGLAVAHPGREWRVASAVGLAVLTLAAGRLVLVLSVDAPGIDGWLVKLESVALQIPKATLLALALTGGALALSRFERHRLAATGLAGLAAALAVLSLLGRVTGLDTLFGAPSVGLLPLPTAVALLCIVCGLVLRIGRMPALRTPQPLWRLLLALGCATVAPLLLYGAYAGGRMAEAQLDQVRKDLMNQARAVSAQIDRQLIAETEKLQVLAASPSLKQGDFAAFQHQAEAALPGPHQGLILLVDPPTMEQLMDTWVPYGTPLPKAIIRDPVERALASGRPYYTGLFMGPVAGRLLFGIIVPVAIDGAYRYALGASPDRKAFGSMVAALELPPGWQAVVTDAQHRILARSGQEDQVIGTLLPEAQWDHGGSSGIVEFTGVDGRPAIQAYAHSDLTGWNTVVWEPEAVLAAPVRALWRTLGWLALLAFMLVAALAVWLGRLIAGSVGHAASAAAALGEGAPLPPGVTPVCEVNTLIGQLHEASARREAVEHRLRESENTFRTMFDMSSVGKIEVVPEDGRFLRVNPAMCHFVGYSEAELLDMTVWDITHPEERARDREPIRRLLTGELSDFDVEKRYIRKDGTPVWAHTTVNLIRDEQGHALRDFAVIQDIDARKLTEQALQASKDRLELALDAARLGSWQFDVARRVFTGTARAKEIFGFDIARNEVPIEDILGRLHPDDVALVLKALADALDPVDPKRAVNLFRLQGGHGEFRWVETLGQAYFEGTGPGRRGVSIAGICQDVTERKEREEREHLLMREVNHRAKNMLSVVHAIAHQTATRNPEDFIARFSERIQALSANQDLLVRNEWNGVDVEDLARAQLAHFVGLIGGRIGLCGPRLRLRASAAQAIGLALHELATNAGKYGALSSDRGRVYVSWAIDGDIFTMSWREREGPPVTAPQRRGFGTIVMDVMAERSVAGKVDLDYAPEGVTWRLTCPAANAIELRERDGNPGEGDQTGGCQTAAAAVPAATGFSVTDTTAFGHSSVGDVPAGDVPAGDVPAGGGVLLPGPPGLSGPSTVESR
jgi:PAS domain S-box-containing protein